jgi:hypothetical protein
VDQLRRLVGNEIADAFGRFYSTTVVGYVAGPADSSRISSPR